MNPVWDLWRRRTFSRLAYWLTALGYDARDRSGTNRVYLIYFCGFWLIWISVVLDLLGIWFAGGLRVMQKVDPLQEVVLLSGGALAGWVLLQLWQAARRSPFVFSEEDGFLLCQTPVSRRTVGLAWFLQAWFETVPAFAAGAVILSFALVELGPRQELLPLMLAQYLGAGLRALGIVLPLHLALQAGVWSLGALRLHPRSRQTRPWTGLLRLAAPLAALVLLGSLLIPAASRILLLPISFPLRAAFSGSGQEALWLEGFSLCFLYLAAGLWGLARAAAGIHLGQAAQETRLRAAIQLALSYRQNELASALRQRERLEAASQPSSLPARPGRWSLVWKDALQSLRSPGIGPVLRWAWVFALSLGMLIHSSWSFQLITGCLWILALASLTTQRLRSDLARWWVLRSLPLRGRDLLAAELTLSCGLGSLLAWLALALSGRPPGFCLVAVLLLPILIVNAALSGTRDILRHASARVLMTPGIATENVPQVGVGGAIQGLITVLLPGLTFFWLATQATPILAALFSLPLAAGITAVNLNFTLVAYRWIE